MVNILISFLLAISFWFQIDLSSVRSNFEKSDTSKEAAATLYNQLKNYNKTDPVLLAYKGAAYAMQARYASDRKDKKELFVAGAKDIESAVAAAPNNVEIRLVRLIIQENTPKILKYKGNINTDKQMILSNFGSQTKVVKDMVKRYADSRSAVFTAAELRTLTP
ncbi:hypothetical protein [Sphingobacterium paucimobilis]|uniref:Uncharacterized protein n=1 Tax=Sphingobacterium paucimobilis HER1398 TaxID=1346330 RepID=U2J749_9SPHI|nr:hypothetical protein [Sphingobacterium paucimobilis]ERJ58483.1 hypothetical protein M472_06860 [Sphingobacterium paucimobilis HER1398]